MERIAAIPIMALTIFNVCLSSRNLWRNFKNNGTFNRKAIEIICIIINIIIFTLIYVKAV